MLIYICYALYFFLMIVQALILMKRRLLEFKYGLLWLAVFILLVFLSLRNCFFQDWIFDKSFGRIDWILLIISFTTTLFSFNISIAITQVDRKIAKMIQEVGMIESRIGDKQ